MKSHPRIFKKHRTLIKNIKKGILYKRVGISEFYNDVTYVWKQDKEQVAFNIRPIRGMYYYLTKGSNYLKSSMLPPDLKVVKMSRTVLNAKTKIYTNSYFSPIIKNYRRVFNA